MLESVLLVITIITIVARGSPQTVFAIKLHAACNITVTCEHGIAYKRVALYCVTTVLTLFRASKMVPLTRWPHETHHHPVSACSHVHLQLQHHTDTDLRASAHPLHGGHCKLGR